MHLTNLIDLIAEVAAKRVAKEGKPKEDSPDAAIFFLPDDLGGIMKRMP